MIFSQDYKNHYKENLRIGFPVIMGQVGHMMTSLVDNAMVGNINSTLLAASSLANTVFIMIYIFGIGLSIGLTPAVGRAYGNEKHGQIASYLKNGKIIYLWTGLLLTIAMWVASYFFDKLDQPPEVVELAIPYFLTLSISMVPFMYYMSLKQFAEGVTLTMPAMWAGLAGNIINIILNYLLIYGEFGFPRWELFGAGVATTIARSLMAVFLFLILSRDKRVQKYLRAAKRLKIRRESIVNLLKIGVPIGFQFVLEVSAFVAGTIMMGWLGVYPLAAHQIAISLSALAFLAATGIATAATIRVSNFLGNEKYHKMRDAGNSAYVMGMALMIFTALCFIFLGRQISMIFTNDEMVIAISTQLLMIAGFFQIVDGAQAVGLGVLRGLEDVKIPTIIVVIAYWGLSIPLSYIFAFTMGMGAVGVWYGYLAGLSFSGLFLYLRFLHYSKKLTGKVV
ncbi:MAG: MATE family efflux transporter [Ignavibacteriae bacterium HGW-Ignavibacteriae-4]|jgi:MATE family multidrug resistance protein|nr:MAG: MATE family efflux transporter [Ignavibacteriae bacterium HGW-Ignavibacteriae-4]